MLILQKKQGTSVPLTSSIRTIGGGGSDIGRGIGVDSSNNIYVGGYSNAPGDWDIYTIKYDSSNVLQWQRQLRVSSTAEQAYSASVNSSGDIAFAGSKETSNNAFIGKYNSAGVLQWQRELNGPDDLSDVAYDVYIDDSGNVYVMGDTIVPGASFRDVFLVKYDASGNIVLNKTYNEVGDNDQTGQGAIALDSSGNIYLKGSSRFQSPSLNYGIFLLKLNSSGVIQWQRGLYDASGNMPTTQYGMSVTPNDNDVYMVVNDAPGGGIAKYNSAGVFQWEQRFSNNETFWGVAADNTDAYLVGYDNSNTQLLVSKWSSAGVLQWQRYISHLSGNEYGYAVELSDSNVYVTGRLNSSILVSIPYALESVNKLIVCSSVPASEAGEKCWRPP